MSSFSDNNSSISYDYDCSTEAIVDISLWFVFFAVGVPGNVLILTVNRRRAVKTGTRVFMSALALTDLASCVMRLANAIWYIVDLNSSEEAFTGDDDEYWDFNVISYLVIGFILSTAFLTVAVAVNRKHSVCKPHSRRISPYRARLTSVLCVVIAFLTVVPAALYTHTYDGDTVLIYLNIIPVSMYIICLFLVLGLYGNILYFLRRSRRIVPQHNVPTRTLENFNIDGEKNELATLSDGRVKDGQNTKPRPTETPRETVCGPSLDPAERPTSNCDENGNDSKDNTNQSVVVSNTRELATDVVIIKYTNPSFRTIAPRNKPCMKPEACPKPTRGKTTLKLALTTTTFFVLSFPFIAYSIVIVIICDLLEDCAISFRAEEVLASTWNLVYLNSAVNPFIYGLVDRRFRTECKVVIRKCCRRN